MSLPSPLRAALRALVFACWLPACAGEEPRLSALRACAQNSDCAAPLVCALGACRSECATEADCTKGGACVTDGEHAVCQAPAERNKACDGPSDCAAPLVCSADFRCRNACNTDADCNTLGARGRVCARDALGAQFCAVEAETADGALIAEPPDDAPATLATTLPAGLGATRAGFIGPEGGALGLGAVLLTVPPGAAERLLPFTLVEVASPTPGALGKSYALGPVGVTFQSPLRVGLRGPTSANVTLATYQNGALVELADLERDPVSGTLSGSTERLGLFFLAPSDLNVGTAQDAVDSTGAPCEDSADCLGAAPLCLTTASSPSGVSYPGGYCSATCTTDEACNAAGDTSRGCPFAHNASSLAPALCHQRCTASADCRTGYSCETFRALYTSYGVPSGLLGTASDDERYCVARGARGAAPEVGAGLDAGAAVAADAAPLFPPYTGMATGACPAPLQCASDTSEMFTVGNARSCIENPEGLPPRCSGGGLLCFVAGVQGTCRTVSGLGAFCIVQCGVFPGTLPVVDAAIFDAGSDAG